MTIANPNAPRQVLKRYPKGEVFHDASIDISAIPSSDLLTALGVAEGHVLVGPLELDQTAASGLGKLMKLEFDLSAFDFFVHSYLDDSNGPAGVVPEPGHVWESIRPQNGEETWVQVPEGE